MSQDREREGAAMVSGLGGEEGRLGLLPEMKSTQPDRRCLPTGTPGPTDSLSASPISSLSSAQSPWGADTQLRADQVSGLGSRSRC